MPDRTAPSTPRWSSAGVGKGCRRKGFFDLAVELGRFLADPAEHAEAWRQEFMRTLAVK